MECLMKFVQIDGLAFMRTETGKRRLKYNGYLSRREEKKKEYEKMNQETQSKM